MATQGEVPSGSSNDGSESESQGTTEPLLDDLALLQILRNVDDPSLVALRVRRRG